VLVALAIAVALATIGLRPLGPATFAGGLNAVTFEDRSGLPLGTVLADDRQDAVRVPLARVSPHFLAAIVATEDARFRHHDGVDGVALVRAAAQGVASGRVVSGASTITMQLARMRFGILRTALGKLQEIVLARRIERGMTKAQILEAYVNRLPMGGDLVGVEAAARTYFGMPAAELDLAQSALLAALPNDPVRLDPYAHPAALERRRRRVLARMVETGAITATEATRAERERIRLAPAPPGIVAAPHLLLRLAGNLPPDTVRVVTTLDRPLQRFVENATAHVVGALGERGVRDGAALVIENRTGAILAYAGSAGYFAQTGAGKNDGVIALRQPGSTLKPFLYELAFEQRVTRPTTILPDVPTSYALPGLRSYAPSDYSSRFAGPVRARIALADSLNVPAVRVLSAIGVPAFLARLRALGFTHLTRSADTYGLGLALGDGEVTLEELAGAYALLANQGQPVRVHALAGAPPAPAGRVGAASEWALVTDMLADAHARARTFGAASQLSTSFPSAVKTGTSSDFRDTWTVGFTRDYTVATWVGNFDGSPMRRVSGVTGAAPLWHRIIAHLAERAVPPAFDAPTGYVARPMCATTGVRATPSCDSVVTELLDRRDMLVWKHRPQPLDRSYDAWLAAQPPSPGEALRIVAPHDGDVFEAAAGARIMVIARGSRSPQWDLNGTALAERDPRWILPLRRGRWTVRARSGSAVDRVTFIVRDPLPRTHRAGFTVAN
jgi:penicillin-binding protein 1C